MRHNIDFEDASYEAFINPSEKDTVFLEQLALR